MGYFFNNWEDHKSDPRIVNACKDVKNQNSPYANGGCLDDLTNNFIEVLVHMKSYIYSGFKAHNKYYKKAEKLKNPNNGGYCMCPNGEKYLVSDNNDDCKSLACEDGVSLGCNTNVDTRGYAVICEKNSLIGIINKGFVNLKGSLESCTLNKDFIEKSPKCVEFIQANLLDDNTKSWLENSTSYMNIISKWDKIQKVVRKFQDKEFWLEAPEDCGSLGF